MNVRPVTAADASTVALHRYPEEADAEARPVYAAWLTGALERGLYLGFLAVTGGGEVVAGAGLTLLQWGPTRGDPQLWRGRVVNVWTDPEWRRQGLARALVTLCLKAAQQRGITRVSLGTTEMGRPLYEALGFTSSQTEMYRQPAPES